MKKVYKFSKETREKMRVSATGRIFSEGAKLKMRLAKLGKKRSKESIRKSVRSRKGYRHSEETIEKIRKGNFNNPGKRARRGKDNPCYGTHPSRETLKKLSESHKGKKFSIETIIKKSEAQKGEKGSNWQGGKTKSHFIVRGSFKYRLWRKKVFERDGYTCVLCGDDKGGNLNADHIKQFAFYPELRFEVSNGRTLCVSCHRKTDTYARRKLNS